MRALMLLAMGFALAWPQDTDEARRAIDIVKKADGTIGFDDKAPDKPVVSVNL